MNNLFIEKNICRTCDSKNIKLVKKMNPVAIAGPNTGIKDKNSKGITTNELIPLSLYICNSCLNLQINETIYPEILYRNFKYTTSITHGLIDHFDSFANDKLINNEVSIDDFVLDIGSNDGSLLAAFKKIGCKVLGVEPATKLADKVNKQGLNTIPEFFCEKLAKKIVLKFGIPKLIVCNNTLANIDNLNDFIKGIEILTDSKTVVYVETQYGMDVLERMLIDTIYHEHLNYFTIHSLDKLLLKFNLYINNVEHLENKGGSIRLKLSKTKNETNVLDNYKLENLDRIRFLIEDINNSISLCNNDLKKIIDNINQGQKLYLFGSAVSCVSLANQLDFDLNKVEAIIDENPLTEICYIRNHKIKVIHLNKILKSEDLIILNLLSLKPIIPCPF